MPNSPVHFSLRSRLKSRLVARFLAATQTPQTRRTSTLASSPLQKSPGSPYFKFLPSIIPIIPNFFDYPRIENITNFYNCPLSFQFQLKFVSTSIYKSNGSRSHDELGYREVDDDEDVEGEVILRSSAMAIPKKKGNDRQVPA